MEYQKQYNKNHVAISNALQTNGYALNEEWCQFLKENHFLVDSPWTERRRFTMPTGMTRLETALMPGSNHAADLMDQYQVDYNILTVVTADIAERIEEIYAEYRKNGWHYQQYIPCLDPMEEGHGKTSYALNPEQYGSFLIRLFRLWYKDLRKGRQPFIRTFENYVALAAGYQAEACEQRGICGIQYVVEADGSVYPCDFYMLDEYRLGNFNPDLLDVIDKKREDIGFISHSRKIPEGCAACPHYMLCRGGCQRSRDLHPETGLYTNYFCEGYRMFFDACGDTIREIAAQLQR